eukprot:Anaeramoba_flamelloidesa567285_39.p1 GENE.a567285_39~~a567285_39.p1  ORF type:complete len:347 (+),score=79.10 a567285_39:113-1153(+)
MKQERINSAKKNLNQNSHIMSSENDLDIKSQNSQTNSQRSQTKSQKSQTNSQTNSQRSQTNSQKSQTKSQISQTNSQQSLNSKAKSENSEQISNNTKSQLNINNDKNKTVDEQKVVSSEQEDINNLYGSSESEIDTNDNTSINKDNSSSFSVDTWGSSEMNSTTSKEQTSKKQEIKKEQIDNFLNELKKTKTVQDYLSIPKQLKLYLDVMYIKDKKESINISLTTTFIKAGNPIIEEEPCYLVLTNKFVYLFLQNKNIKENLAWKKKNRHHEANYMGIWTAILSNGFHGKFQFHFLHQKFRHNIQFYKRTKIFPSEYGTNGARCDHYPKLFEANYPEGISPPDKKI